MAGTTIGRVEFIVDLDGGKLPGQARKIASEIARAGKSAGNDFGGEFENSFSHRLSDMGATWAASMQKQGRLASETFMVTFERGLKARQSKIQGTLVGALLDKDDFRAYAAGFDSVDEAVDRLKADLEDLNRQNIKTSKGGRAQVILQKRFEEATAAADALGSELKETLEQEAELEKQTERLDADIARLTRTIGDTGAFRTASERIGSTSTAYRRLREEIDGLAGANKIGLVEQERMIDSLDRTRESVDGAIRAERDLARQQRDSADAAAENADKQKRLASALADIDRQMGNLDAYRERVRELGSTSRATDELKKSIDKLSDLGHSERSIVGLHNKLKSFNRTLDRDSATPAKWGDGMEKVIQKVSGAWRRMDGTVKLVLASVIGAGPEVAALGSALGAGLIAVGGAVTSMVIGVGAGIAVFSNLMQDIKGAPAAMKPAIRSFQNFGHTIEDVNDSIAQAAFDEMGDAFTTLSKTARALEPALDKVGASLGRLIKGFTEGTKPGTAAFKEINKAIELAGPNLEKLGGIVGTFGTALIRAFNGAQPLVQDMLNWFGKLADRFDKFTASSAFDDWVNNARDVWDAFGGTLDAVSKALSDLVTPEAIANTIKLLENLERLAPSISNLLAIFGALDPLGLFVDILADIGESLAPLTPLLVGAASGLNDLIEAIPPGVWLAAAGAVTAFFAAFAASKVITGVSAMLGSMGKAVGVLGFEMATAAPKAKTFGGVLKSFAKFGAISAAIVGASIAVDVFTKSIEEGVPKLRDIEGAAKRGSSAMDLLRTASQRSGTEKAFWGDYQDSLKDLPKLLNDADAAASKFGGETLNLTQNQQGAVDSLKRLGEGLAALAEDDMPAAQKSFQKIVKEFNLTDKEAANLLSRMGPLSGSFETAAEGADGFATEAETLNFALGRTVPAAEGTLNAFLGLSGSMEDTAMAAELQADALELLTGKSLAALDAVEGVADGIKTMGSAFRDERSAARDYEAALDDLTASIGENGSTLDITTTEGRENQAALDAMAASTLALAGETYNLTGSQEGASAAIQTGRDALIEQLAAFGITGDEANAYADKLGLIPGDVETLISANTAAGMEMADAFATRLYELGLIEVNPVLALDAVDAQAEADKIQAELDGLTLNSYVTTLDANGDPVSGVVEATSRSLDGFVNTKHTTTLDANGDPASGVIDAQMSKLATYESSTHTTKLDANGDPAGAVLEKTAGKMKTFGGQTFTPTLDVNNIPATGKISTTEKKLNTLDSSTSVPKIDVNDSKASSKMSATTAELNKIDKKVATPDIDVDNSGALSGISSVQGSLNRLPTNKTITITTVHKSVTQDSRAAGGIASTPTLSIWGEAGPEALVPLSRPLSQVDPSVRALSAVAQGMAPVVSSLTAGGGGKSTVTGPSRVVNIQPGAIVIQGSLQPEAMATMTVNRIAERAIG